MQNDLRDTALFKSLQKADADWLQMGGRRPPDLYDIALSPDGSTIAGSERVAGSCRALLQHGVKSMLVHYPKEGHWVQHHPAIADCGARIVSWFQEHMPA